MDYEIDGRGFHQFLNFKSEPDVLLAIMRWFNSLNENEPTLHSINFKHFNDETVDADVFWSYLTREKKAKAEIMLSQMKDIHRN